MVKPIVKFLIKTNIWYNNSQNPELSINAPKNLRVSSSERIYRKGKSFINTFFMNKSKNCPKKI